MEVFRRLILQRNTNLITKTNLFVRTIMTSKELQAKIESVEEELKTNPYYSKYLDKIAKLQQTSPEEFLSRVEAVKSVKEKPKLSADEQRNYSSLLNPKKQLAESLDVQDEPLSKVMKVELIENEEAENISTIWEAYHKQQKDFIAASIPAKHYDKICEHAVKYPTFLFPIPRSQGYEFVLCQFYRNTIHFTPLLNYQVHKENAPECLTIKHYTEFKDSKGIVLMRGEFDKNVLNGQEAQCLANQLQLYYSQEDAEKLRLMELFSKKPDEFKHMDLIKQIESLSIS